MISQWQPTQRRNLIKVSILVWCVDIPVHSSPALLPPAFRHQSNPRTIHTRRHTPHSKEKTTTTKIMSTGLVLLFATAVRADSPCHAPHPLVSQNHIAPRTPHIALLALGMIHPCLPFVPATSPNGVQAHRLQHMSLTKPP